MRSSNPVLTRLGASAQQYGGYQPAPSPGTSYPSPIVPGTTDRVTVDDVVVRTVFLLAVTVVSAAIAWALVPFSAVGAVWIAAALVGLGIGLAISFSGSTNPVLMTVYAVVEGIFVGMLSKAYNAYYGGIVMQAVLATLAIFLVMSLLYKSKTLRATPRFNRILAGCLTGAVVVILGNLALSFFGVDTPLNGNGPIALLFSLGIVILGALSFISDFDLIERAVAAGMPKRIAWTCSFGLLVSIIWVYIYVVRLLGILRSN